MRKRCIISILLVFVILGLSHNAWLTIKPKSPVAVQTVRGGGGSSLPAINSQSRKSVRPSVKFDALLFIIIAILGYLLSYKLTSYLADFKTEKKYSRIDIVFLAVCTVIMFLPMSHISDAKKSDTENRNLAVWKPFINKKGQINYNFGRDYDKWFSDRFNLRNLLLKFNAKFVLDKNQPDVVIGKDDWLFYKGENGVRNFLNLDLFTDDELKYIANYLVSVDEYCKQRNKRFYFFIGPDKNKIYGEYYPDYIKQTIPNSKSRAMQLINYLHKHTDIKVIYPYNELYQAKEKGELLYWKNDTHWNSLGGYVGYKALTDALINDGVDIEPVKPEKFVRYKAGIKELDNMLIGLSKSAAANTEYVDAFITKDYEFSIKDTTPNDLLSHNDMFSHKDIDTPKLVMFRDSFSRAMLPFISNTFRDVSYYWTYDVKKSDIGDADVVILQTVERFLFCFVKRKFL